MRLSIIIVKWEISGCQQVTALRMCIQALPRSFALVACLELPFSLLFAQTPHLPLGSLKLLGSGLG